MENKLILKRRNWRDVRGQSLSHPCAVLIILAIIPTLK